MTVEQILETYPYPIGLIVRNGLYGVVIGFEQDSLHIRFVEGRISGGWKYIGQQMEVIPSDLVPHHLQVRIDQVLDDLTKSEESA